MTFELAPILPEAKQFGTLETVPIPVDTLVRLPQVREGINPNLPALVESIRARGLINAIDVSKMTQSSLETYINFVNRTWGTEVSIEDYSEQQLPDGTYYLVVAGHSRCEAIRQIQEEDAGRNYSLAANIRSVHTPEDILALQIEENTYGKPTLERRAVAVVELFQYGLETRKWRNKAEFLRTQGGKISRSILNEAIGFAQLPRGAREFVFSGQLSYSAAVAIGQATDVIMEYTASQLGDTGPDMQLEAYNQRFEEAYRSQIGLMIAGICNRSLNGPAAKRYIDGQISLMRNALIRSTSPATETLSFDFALVTPDQTQQIYLAKLRKEYAVAMEEMARRSVGSVHRALELHLALIGNEGSEHFRIEQRHRTRLLARLAVGSI